VTADHETSLKPDSPASLGPELPPADGSGSPAAAREPAPKSPEPSRRAIAALWVHRARMLLLVALCAVMGVFLVVLPWSLQWTDNHLLWGHPQLRAFLAHGFVRGVCSGLGLLDLWIGFREAVHYHENPDTAK
jgi:hypothetical protein